MLSSQSWTIVTDKEKTPERFKYYQTVGKKQETLDVIYLTWPDKKLPNFVRVEDFKKFGNTNNKDWYVFTGFTLTYTFGNKPCYCRE